MMRAVTGAFTLYIDAFWSSPYDFRCYVALMEKGLPFAVSRQMIGEGQGLGLAYKEQSITGRVPGMSHGDFWLAESQAIVEYLEDAFPPPDWPKLLPDDVRLRARARQVMGFVGSEFLVMRAERPAWMIAYPSAPPPLSPVARAEADALINLATGLVARGELAEFSMATADVVFALLRLSRTGEVLPPALQAMVDETCGRPSVRAYLEHSRPPNPPVTGRRATV
jgi:glutathione S-transferase